MTTEMSDVAIESIHLPDVILREAKTNTVQFEELLTSIKNEGVLLPIRIRPYMTPAQYDADGNVVEEAKEDEDRYFIVDGLQRFTAAKQLNFKTIPAVIADVDEGKAMKQMLIANTHKLETTRSEQCDHLVLILSESPEQSVAELAREMSMSEARVKNILSLDKLFKVDESLKEAVDNGEIIASNAYALSRLPKEQIADFIEDAKTMDASDFTARIRDQVKANNAAKKAGRDEAQVEWTPALRGQTFSVLRNEYWLFNDIEADERTASELTDVLIQDFNLDPSDASTKATVAAVLSWAVSMHPSEVARKTEEHEAKVKEREEKKARKEAEKEAKKAKKDDGTEVVFGVKK